MSLVVVATDTEVGKTVVSALLMTRYGGSDSGSDPADRVPDLAYWKPLATGSRDERDVETVEALCPGVATLPESYLFREPLSPHLAARLEDRAIDLEVVVQQGEEHRRSRPLVVEGVGGVLVPLVETDSASDPASDPGPLLTDLLERFGLPVVVVVRSALGTINHSLLTFEALRRRQIEIIGAVMVGPENPENRKAIERWGQVEVVAEVPWLDPLDATTVARAARDFDPEGRLRPWIVGPHTEGSR